MTYAGKKISNAESFDETSGFLHKHMKTARSALGEAREQFGNTDGRTLWLRCQLASLVSKISDVASIVFDVE